MWLSGVRKCNKKIERKSVMQKWKESREKKFEQVD